MTAAAPPPPIAVTKLPFCNNGSNRYSINVSAHCFFTCLCYIYTHEEKNMRAPPRQRVWSAIQSCLCSRPLHQNLAFMLDSAAPHAIRKSDIIDQSSNSRLFQQTEREKKEKKKKKNRFKLSCTEQRCSRQLCVHLLFVLTAILSNWWGSSLVTAGLRYKKVE